MARSHARILTSIWDDPDFLALPSGAQRCYFMLLSQPDLGHAGVLSTTVRRWALLSADEDESAVRGELDVLAERRFVLVDERTEELLIRSLIRNDGVWKQPKVLTVAIAEAARIRSPRLRAGVAAELARLEVAALPDKTRPEVEKILANLPPRLAQAHAELVAKAPADGGSQALANPPAQAPAQVPAEGSAYTRARSPAPTPTPAIQLPAAADEPRLALSVTQRSKVITDAYAEAVPLCKWPAINGIVIKAIKTELYADGEIGGALLRLASAGIPVTVDRLRVELEGLPPASWQGGNGRRGSTTDDRVAQAQALKLQPGADSGGPLPPNTIPGMVA